MVTRVNHGGGCCGMNHIYSFPNTAIADSVTQLDRLIENRVTERSQGLIEIVLTDEQCRDGTWPAVLEARRFILKTRFFNSNSGNYCNVFHLTTGQPAGRSRTERPFNYRYVFTRERRNTNRRNEDV